MPLKVFPTMTNSPVAGSRAPRWMLDSFPRRRPDPHSTASTTRSSVCTGLTFSQPAPRRPAWYGASGDLAITPSWPAASVASRKAAASAGSDVDSRPTRCAGGTSASSAASRSVVGASSRSAPSQCRMSKKNTESRWAPLAAVRDTSTDRPNRDAVTWKRCGRLSGRSAIASPSAIRSRYRQCQRRLHHLGQPGGDVVEASGVDGDLVAGPMDLHPCAVQLGLENRCAAVTFQRVGHAGRGLCQHRADRLADPQRQRVQGRRAAGQRGAATAGRSPPSIAARCTGGGGDVGGLGHRVGHDPGQRALTQLAAEQPQQKHLLGFGCRGEQCGDEFGAPRLGPLARHRADRREGGVDAGDGQHRIAARAAAATAATPSRHRSGAAAAHRRARTRRSRHQPRVGRGAAQQLGDARDLGQPRGGAAHVERRGRPRREGARAQLGMAR